MQIPLTHWQERFLASDFADFRKITRKYVKILHICEFSFEKAECYGVVVGDGTPATHIRLRAFGRERYAMQDLPVHHSQQLVAQGPDYCDFEVYLRPTTDFKAYIASKGQWLVVLSPQSLAQDVMAIHQEALDKYKSMMEGSFGAP